VKSGLWIEKTSIMFYNTLLLEITDEKEKSR